MKNTPYIRNDNLKAQACKLYVNRVSTYIHAAVLKKDVKKTMPVTLSIAFKYNMIYYKRNSYYKQAVTKEISMAKYCAWHVKY